MFGVRARSRGVKDRCADRVNSGGRLSGGGCRGLEESLAALLGGFASTPAPSIRLPKVFYPHAARTKRGAQIFVARSASSSMRSDCLIKISLGRSGVPRAGPRRRRGPPTESEVFGDKSVKSNRQPFTIGQDLITTIITRIYVLICLLQLRP